METQVNESQQEQVSTLAADVEELKHGPAVSAGRIVHYVMADGQVRPLIVTKARRDPLGHVNGVLFYDGSNDYHALPIPRPDHDHVGKPFMHLDAIRYDATGNAGTWHWPEKV
jgi:hypothetical protein